jgi:hypothetical protein
LYWHLTEVTAYQYLGMTKIAGALNMLPKTILNKTITNESTNEAIKIYQADRNYPKFACVVAVGLLVGI